MELKKEIAGCLPSSALVYELHDVNKLIAEKDEEIEQLRNDCDTCYWKHEGVANGQRADIAEAEVGRLKAVNSDRLDDISVQRQRAARAEARLKIATDALKKGKVEDADASMSNLIVVQEIICINSKALAAMEGKNEGSADRTEGQK